MSVIADTMPRIQVVAGIGELYPLAPIQALCDAERGVMGQDVDTAYANLVRMHESSIIHAARVGQQVWGLAQTTEDASRECGILQSIYVNPIVRRRGVGRELLGHVLQYAQQRGHRSVRAQLPDSVLPFFEKQGFRMQPEGAGYRAEYDLR
ncbi:MAG: GNAT family N-acetyltransferase [Nanoarchaeota archaeon]